jgi:hypothetical protein
LVAAGAALPSAAGAATREPAAHGHSLDFQAPYGHVSDRLLVRDSGSLRRAAERAQWVSYPLLDGSAVRAASAYYPTAEIHEVVAVLGGLVHGREMNSLSVYVATPEEISGMCGAGMMGCYSPSSDRIVVSGSDAPVAGIPRTHAIAHEYGHHIANHRVNGPWWSALYAGTKRWTTYERVCEEAGQGRLYPGDQGAHYWENPGEAFAESYATMNFPGLGLAWNYTPLLQPDAASLERIRADVTRPWVGPRTTNWQGRIDRRGGTAARQLATPLDGRVKVRMTAPEGSNFDLYLLSADPGPRQVLRRMTAGDSDKRVAAAVCGEQAVRIEVRGPGSAGPFSVKITRP